MSVFALVKDNINIVDAAQRYGVAVDRSNKAVCPFHGDSHPSMSFKNGRFTCFACGARGDVIDLVGRLIQSSAIDTVKELNASYQLGIDFNQQDEQKAKRQAMQMARQKQLFKEWEQRASNLYARYFNLLRQWKQEYAPKYFNDALHPFFTEACAKLDYIEYLCNTVFICGSPEDKKRFYFSHHHQTEQLQIRLDSLENKKGMVA